MVTAPPFVNSDTTRRSPSTWSPENGTLGPPGAVSHATSSCKNQKPTLPVAGVGVALEARSRGSRRQLSAPRAVGRERRGVRVHHVRLAVHIGAVAALPSGRDGQRVLRARGEGRRVRCVERAVRVHVEVGVEAGVSRSRAGSGSFGVAPSSDPAGAPFGGEEAVPVDRLGVAGRMSVVVLANMSASSWKSSSWTARTAPAVASRRYDDSHDRDGGQRTPAAPFGVIARLNTMASSPYMNRSLPMSPGPWAAAIRCRIP